MSVYFGDEGLFCIDIESDKVREIGIKVGLEEVRRNDDVSTLCGNTSMWKNVVEDIVG